MSKCRAAASLRVVEKSAAVALRGESTGSGFGGTRFVMNAMNGVCHRLVCVCVCDVCLCTVTLNRVEDSGFYTVFTRDRTIVTDRD